MRRSVALLGLVLMLLAVGPAAGIPGDLTVGPLPRGEEEEEEAVDHAARAEADGAGRAEPGPAGADQWFVAQRQYPYGTQAPLDPRTSSAFASM